MQTIEIDVNNHKAQGVIIPLPNANLIVITGPKGYLMCGYLNLEAAEKKGDVAAIITGVATVEDMLQGRVVAITSPAQKAGISIGMTGRQALPYLF
jgi:uncharacterized protein YunC (DUF1805 family)